MFEGCCIKVFSRKQECPALSSAEAVVCDDRKLEGVGVVRHVVGIHFGWIPLTILGTPQCTTGTYHLVLRSDATAAISISSMEGLLRRVRHIDSRHTTFLRRNCLWQWWALSIGHGRQHVTQKRQRVPSIFDPRCWAKRCNSSQFLNGLRS